MFHKPWVSTSRSIGINRLNIFAVWVVLPDLCVKAKGRGVAILILRFPLNHLRKPKLAVRVLPAIILLIDAMKIRNLELPRVMLVHT